MTHKDDVDKNVDIKSFLEDLREIALVVGEDCPEGHRKDPGSGRCLPMGSTDHTAFTRSLNVDDGPQWRGEEDKKNTTFASNKEAAIDADEMDEPTSCANGTTFSFVQRKCISLEEAEEENNGLFAFIEVDENEEDARNGHEEIISKDPEGRRDTVNFECPANQFFDHKRRECIPLNKDTVLASEDLDEEFKKAVAMHLSGRLAVTSSDPLDGHRHLVTVDEEGNGKTSVASPYIDGKNYYHSHNVAGYVVEEYSSDGYTSRHFGHAIPKEMYEYERDDYANESVPAVAEEEKAKELTSKKRKNLPDSSFGVPGKRKFPLHDCSHVRNAMARFNQAKGLTSGEKATLRRKILSKAKACDIKVEDFGKANTEEEFAAVVQELIAMETKNDKARLEAYRAAAQKQGPCPPGMVWDPKTKKCTKVRGFVEELANHSDIVRKQPEGRRDTVGFQCPDGEFFDFTNRRCLPLDPSRKPGTTTTKANEEEDAAKRDLSPLPEGKPARLPQDCPEGTIWDGDLRKCKPLDSRKKTKSSEEDAAMPDFIKKMMDKKKGKKGNDKKSKSEDESAQAPASGPGKEKDDHGCAPHQVWNPKTEKCEARKGQFKGKSESESAGREGLTTEVPGKVKLPQDCPPGTLWDGTRRTCTPLSTMDKNRPSGSPGPMNPKDVASAMSVAQLVQALDVIIKEEGNKEKSKVAARDLPNAAFPPSLVSTTHRSLMHHAPDVQDPYDTASVDVVRLRNALFRANSVKGFSTKAVEDAIEHLVFHAQEVVAEHLGKKA